MTTGTPYIFEISWEVCNMVGGIHTVLATKAPFMTELYDGGYVAIGPDLSMMGETSSAFVEECWDEELLECLRGQDIGVRMGRWLVPGEPHCLLVNHSTMYAQKDAILARYWEAHGLDSLFGGWDYYDPLLFGHAAGLVIDHIYKQYLFPRRREALVHCHEWMATGAILHLKDEVPEIGTLFTTHATTLGRAMGNTHPGKTPAQLLESISAADAARELNVVAKHSIESIAAREVDIFSTVSEVTAEECELILGRRPEMVMPNGLGRLATSAEAAANARERLFQIAEMATGDTYDRQNTHVVISAGRYEFLNKGIDIFLDALAEVRSAALDGEDRIGKRRVLAFVMYPTGHTGPKRVMRDAADGHRGEHAPLRCTHFLRDEAHDPITFRMKELELDNAAGDPVHVLQIPIYLDGSDPIIKESYWELLSGASLGLFPSWYEPWGYTPMEAVGLGVPSLTTDLAGFGRWVRERGDFHATGVEVLEREHHTTEIITRRLAEFILDYVAMDPTEKAALIGGCLATADATDWSELIRHYVDAYSAGSEIAHARRRELPRHRFVSMAEPAVIAETKEGELRALVRHFTVRNRIPEELLPLRELATNLWWRWHPEASSLFADISPELWAACRENPNILLEQAPVGRLEELARDQAYLKRVSEQMDLCREAAKSDETDIAYFCMEYGIAGFLSLYSGGLGILAGDHLKAAADRNLNLVAVGLAYEEGYFRQIIDAEGRQHAVPDLLDFRQPPFELVLDEQGEPLTVSVPFPTGPVVVRTYRLKVGGIDLYLLNTDHDGNRDQDRPITHNLYGGGTEGRLKQELVLGVGGYTLLGRLGIRPKAFHMNEGHSSFLIFARLANLILNEGLNRREAVEFVRHTTIFTTHTPVPAGHDHFPEDMIRPYLIPFEGALQQDCDGLLAVGSHPADPHREFITTYLALRGSNRVNGVSAKHGEVSQQMFADLYPGLHVSEVPVTSITNGVHVPSWLADDWQELIHEQMGPDWRDHLSEPERWHWIHNVSNHTVWEIREKLRAQLVDHLRTHVAEAGMRRHEDPVNVGRTLEALKNPGLIIGFARRFAPYKRADLLFGEEERLAAVLKGNPGAILLYAGKAHPADIHGQEILQRVFQMARHPELAGRVIVLEGYDIDLARKMVQGCDIWLNTPTRPLEASGTSGMKAAINGCLNLSVADGWWMEGYTPENGWSIEAPSTVSDLAHGYDQNSYDRASIFAFLEGDILPTFADRDPRGVPVRWVSKVKHALAETIPNFSAHRMVGDYTRRFYEPAVEEAKTLEANGYANLGLLTAHRQRIRKHWQGVAFEDARIEGIEEDSTWLGTPIQVRVELSHPSLKAGDLEVQAILARGRDPEKFESREVVPLEGTGKNGKSVWLGELGPDASGHHRMGFRVVPKQRPEDSPAPINLSLQKWL